MARKKIENDGKTTPVFTPTVKDGKPFRSAPAPERTYMPDKSAIQAFKEKPLVEGYGDVKRGDLNPTEIERDGSGEVLIGGKPRRIVKIHRQAVPYWAGTFDRAQRLKSEEAKARLEAMVSSRNLFTRVNFKPQAFGTALTGTGVRNLEFGRKTGPSGFCDHNGEPRVTKTKGPFGTLKRSYCRLCNDFQGSDFEEAIVEAPRPVANRQGVPSAGVRRPGGPPPQREPRATLPPGWKGRVPAPRKAPVPPPNRDFRRPVKGRS